MKAWALLLCSILAPAVLCAQSAWPEIAVDAASFAAANFDAVTTIQNKAIGGIERDPLARPFVALPNPAYVVAANLFTAGLASLGHRMRRSENGFIRHAWWIPQAAQISINTACGVGNIHERH